MATIVLGIAGQALGASIGGSFLGLSAAAIGGMIGSTVGQVVDSWIISSLAPAQRMEGARLDSLRVTSSTEGAVIPALYGRMRVGGNIIWATDFREETETTEQGGGKGGGPKVESTEYKYYASFALALCEGPIIGIGRVWADGKSLDLEGIDYEVYKGGEAQLPDPIMQAALGVENTPAFRGTAYIRFHDLLLTDFGNRIPQINVEVFRPLADGDVAEGMVEAVTLIPASGEFAYGTTVVKTGSDDEEPMDPQDFWANSDQLVGIGVDQGAARYLNASVRADRSDLQESLDRLKAQVPAVKHVSLVVAWYGDDLRAGSCKVRPCVEESEKPTSPYSWSVNGVSREEAREISRDGFDRPVYGGTPSDRSVIEAIQALRGRGYKVTFYPFIMMDIPAGNSLPDPYSANGAGVGQPAFPWRGRITCHPAPGYAGTVDKTAAANTQMGAFFGSATAAQFAVAPDSVSFTGTPTDWGIRRMILHYAHLCEVAGGVDAFLIGSEMPGVTQVRQNATTSYPAVTSYSTLATDVRGILRAGTEISYAADWSEYHSHRPASEPSTVIFNLDPLWANPAIDFIGIDNYLPIADWRDGEDHLDFNADVGPLSSLDDAYLRSNIQGGELYDWYYASDAHRQSQTRTPINDAAHGEHWVWANKRLIEWLTTPHRNRPGGVRAGTATGFPVGAKPIRFTELGCPAVDRGANQPNVFFDPKSSESFLPYFSRGWRDDAMQRAYLEATYGFWSDPANNPVLPSGGGARAIDIANSAAWTWDARPYPFYPALGEIWSDGDNWRLGHWLNGRLGSVSLRALVRHLCRRAGLADAQIDASRLTGAVEGFMLASLESPKQTIGSLSRMFAFDAAEIDGRIVFVHRGRGTGPVITLEDLVDTGEGDIIEMTRAQETELPQALKWTTSRADEEYDTGAAEARRQTVLAERVQAEQFPAAVSPEETERQCRRALAEAWAGRESAKFGLPLSRLALEPGDALRVQHDGVETRFRIVSTGDGEARTVDVVREDLQAFDQPAGPSRNASMLSTVAFSPPAVAILDLPQLIPSVPAHQPLLAAFTVPWPGALAVYSSVEGGAWQRAATLPAPAIMGKVVDPFYGAPAGRWDYGNVLTVDLLSGQLASATESAVLNGANAIAVSGPSGTWEVVQFCNAELVSPNRWRLTKLLRGARGTEHMIQNPAAAGGMVVVLNAALRPLPITVEDLGTPIHLRIGPAQKPVSDRAFRSVLFTPRGVGLKPWSPDHLTEPWRVGRTGDAITLRWIRRTRVPAGDSWDSVEVPLAEETQEYRVEIMDGASVVRTFEPTAPAITYTAAQQTDDWGAPLERGTIMKVRVRQISQAVGDGVPLIIFLEL